MYRVYFRDTGHGTVSSLNGHAPHPEPLKTIYSLSRPTLGDTPVPPPPYTLHPGRCTNAGWRSFIHSLTHSLFTTRAIHHDMIFLLVETKVIHRRSSYIMISDPTHHTHTFPLFFYHLHPNSVDRCSFQHGYDNKH